MLRELVRSPPRPRRVRVFLCENPVVVSAAADRLGAHCRPLVCASGQLSAAAMHLVRMLVVGGAELFYHGAFDWGGVRIGNVMVKHLPVRPWRFDADAYRSAARRPGLEATPRHRLSGTPVTPTWDGDLGDLSRTPQSRPA